MVAWKKEEGFVTISSECGFVKTLLNWYNNEQHISYLSKVRALLGPISGPISFRHMLCYGTSEEVIWVSFYFSDSNFFIMQLFLSMAVAN